MWIVMFMLRGGTTGRVARKFSEQAAKRYADAMNEKRAGECVYTARPDGER